MAPIDERRITADRLFEAALDLRPEERPPYLDEACDGDAELRRLVERLIAGAELDDTELMSGGGMQGPLWNGLMEDLDAGEDGDAEAASTGTVIGHYRIVRELGRGGMAVVYLAERADGQFEQRVALKRIRSGIDTAEVIQRFDQERQILALAHHPNIAQLLDGGVGTDGRPYFVMEYVEGRPIDRYCDDERLSLTDRLKLFLQVARAVDYAHRNLVVHRDIKPTNILVTAEGHVKLLDFGIAKLLDAEAAPGKRPLTRSVERLMTPTYASPEQIRGEAVTTASDTYQLGVLLYELLTSRWPYRLERHRPMAVVLAICEHEPTRPSTVLIEADGAADDDRPTLEAIGEARRTSTARLKRQLAGDLDTIALMALRKEPERRYGAVAQLIADVESFLSGKPVSARRDTFAYRAGKLVQRHKAAFATAGAAVVLLAALAIFYTVRLARESKRARLAAAEAGQVSEFLSGLFEVSAPTRSQGEQITARQLLDDGAKEIEDELAGQPQRQAAMMTLMGNVYRELALYEEARPLLERAVGLRRGQPGQDRLKLAESLFGLARLEEEEGEHATAQALYEEVLAIREEALGPEDPEVAHALDGLGRVLELQAAYEQARRYHERALGILETALGPGDPEVGRTLLGLGRVLKQTREFDAAKERLTRALEIFESSFGGTHPYVADTQILLASVLRFTDGRAAARAQYEQALPSLEAVYGPDHPAVAVALDALGRLHNAMKERAAAIGYHQRALAIRETAFGANHPLVAASLNNLGIVHWGNKDLETAQGFFERAAAILETVLGPDHVDVSRPLQSLAEILYDTGDVAGAENRFERVVKIRERSLGREHSLVARPLYNLGLLRLERGEAAAAEPLLRRALALGRDHPTHRHGEIIWPRIRLAQCLAVLEHYPEAEELLRRNLDEDGVSLTARRRTREVLVEVYEEWGRPEAARRQRQALVEIEAAAG